LRLQGGVEPPHCYLLTTIAEKALPVKEKDTDTVEIRHKKLRAEGVSILHEGCG
jgi:hypothetical protein